MKQNKEFVYNGYYIEIECYNCSNLLNYLNTQNIIVSNVKLNTNIISFNVNNKNLKAIINYCKNNNCEIKSVNNLGLQKLKTIFKNRLGLFIGGFIAIICIFIANMFTFNYKIIGTSYIDNQLIINAMQDFGIKLNRINNFDTVLLEKHLSNKIEQISMVSVMRVGTTIIINVKEKLPSITSEFLPIIAPENLLINKIEVFAGNTKFKEGDIVKKGEILVDCKMNINGEQKLCKPIAKIDASIWYNNQVIYKTNYNESVRTNKKIEICSVYLGKNKLFETNEINNFDKFEIEEKKINAFNYFFLPIIINKTIIYELTSQEIKKDFEKDKDFVIISCTKDAYNKIPDGVIVSEENVVVNHINDMYYVNVYLKCDVIIGE